jgi:tRNA1Val (adenine37-N6)-methyltransferase
MIMEYMLDYAQPDFYHFSSDSIDLVNYIYEHHDSKHVKRYLDVCSGCGVIGIELSQKIHVENLALCEIQSEYIPFIKSNLQFLPEHTKTQIINSDICDVKEDRFDLITINPPYFRDSSSRLSPDKNKNKCRIYAEFELKEIVRASLKLLSPSGNLYIVIREDKYTDCELDEILAENDFRRIKKGKITIYLF